MIKHYKVLLNKTVTIPVKKWVINITKNLNSATKVLYSLQKTTFAFMLLLIPVIFIATGCGADNNEVVLAESTQSASIAIVSNAMPTATLAPTVRSTEPAPPTRTPPAEEPTATITPSIYPTSPLATPSPTLSLLDVLTQTIVVANQSVADQQVLSSTIFLPLLINEVLSSTETLTQALPLADQPFITATTELTPVVQLTATVVDLQPDGISRTVQIPILMYHYLGTPPPRADIYRRDLTVAPDLFAAQLDRMQADGYTIISLYDLTAHLLEGAPLPEKPVVLTFDDGYRDNYENAFPILRERQLTATFFIVTDFIDRERPEYLTWDMVREMYAGGMSIEVHGVDHTTLRGRSQADLEYQALRSYETIQARIGIRPRFLSYPAGEFDNKAIEMFRSANYWAAVTTIQGTTQQSERQFEYERIRIRATTTPDDLIRLLQAEW